MTAQLRPYQFELYEKLVSGAQPRVIISAPAGVGVSTVLVQVVANTPRDSGSALIVVPGIARLDQWANRLRDAGVQSPAEIRHPSEALIGLEQDQKGVAESLPVILTTIQALWHGAGQKFASILHPSLLIIDLPDSTNTTAGLEFTSRAETLAADLASRSQQVIVKTSSPTPIQWLGVTETLTVTLADALSQRPSRSPVVLVHFPMTNKELELVEQIRALFEETGLSDLTQVSTRPVAYGALTRLAARLDGEAVGYDESLESALAEQALPFRLPDLIDKAWRLVDALEMLGDDTRLTALLALASNAQNENRPILVVTNRVEETEYVASRLREQGFEVGTLSGARDVLDAQRLVEQFHDNAILVTSRLFSEFLNRPPGTEEIWWSPPGTAADVAQRLMRVPSDGRIAALIAEPPVPADRRLVDILRRLELEAGVELSAFNQ